MSSDPTHNVISLPASQDGPTPWPLPDGRVIDPCGLVAALASLSPRQVKALGLTISGISGRPGSISSASVGLQSSLESRLRAATQILGSTLYKMTWKAWNTGSQRSRSRLRASVLRTSATGSTGWPTPTAALAEKGVRTFEGGLMEAMRSHGPDLAAAACLTGWPTATSTDALRCPSINATTPNITLNHAANLAGWNTPDSTMTQAKARPPVLGSRKPTDPQISLADQAFHLAAWPTPNAGTPQSLRGNGQDPERRKEQGHQVNLKDAVRYLIHGTPARLTADGRLLTGSSAGMASGGQLNPAHSRWLMGLPPEWDDCAPTATPSTRKRRKPSSVA